MDKFIVSTAIPARTFLEKIFLLHEEFNRPNGCSHLERLTRHLYDIERMMDCDFANNAIRDSNLYNDIIAHRKEFTAWSGLNYDNHKPSKISFLPPKSILGDLRNDYRKMQEGFIYGDSLPFDDLLKRIEELQTRIRNI